MKISLLKQILTAFVLFLLTLGNLCYSQNNEINIEYIGNCGLHLTDGTTNFYVDFPYKSGAFGYMEYNQSELDSIKENSIFIFTHKHADHYSRRILKKVKKKKNGTSYGVNNINALESLNDSLKNFKIEAFKTVHKVFGISFKHYSYLITWHGKRIYLSGDTTNPETISNIKNINLAFVPYWILQNAKERELTIDAKMFAIYHLYPQQIENALKTWSDIPNIKTLVKTGDRLSL